jgi:hypothetical protein
MNYQNEQELVLFFTPSYGQPPVNVFYMYLNKFSDGQFRGLFY